MPRTSYAKAGDVHIAYQVVGDGPIDIVFVPWWWNHLELQWDDPAIARFLKRLSSFSRLLLFDQRGVGMSDPVSKDSLPTIEQWMDDIRAVMDAAGSTRAAIFGHGDGGFVSMMFAATYPERTSALVLVDTCARIRPDTDYGGVEDEWLDDVLHDIETRWGTGLFLDTIAPSLQHDDAFRERMARTERLSVAPGIAPEIQRIVIETDLRSIVPSISVPTLVLHRKDNRYAPVVWGEYLAAHIAGSRFVVLPGAEHLYWLGASDAMLDEVEEFLTGVRPQAEPDRVLASILFTDIVGSTERAASLGDRAWKDLLATFRRAVRDHLDRYRGREIDTRGDDFLATFDGPARAIRCALALTESAREIGIDVRTGLHTGEVELMERSDIAGIAVHIGARVAALAQPGQVLVSRTVVDLVAGSGLVFEPAGTHHLKGVPGTWEVFSVRA